MEQGCSVCFWGTLAGPEVLSSLLLKPPLQGQDPFLQQQLQQVQDQHTGQQLLPEQQMQERPQQPSATVGNQMLQICLPGQASVAVPLCEDPTTFMQTQPIVVPVQLVAGQQPSGYYQDETLGDDEDDSHR